MSDGLVGYWKMDESAITSGAIDSSGNGNDGTYYGNASTTGGKFGNGGVFDGSGDYVGVGDISDLNFERTDTFSMSAWVKTSDNSASIVGKHNNTPYDGYEIYLQDGYWNINIRNSLTNGIVIRGQSDVGDDIWHHLMFTYNGSSKANGVKLYFDGNEDTDTVDEDNLTDSITNSASFSIGSRNNGVTSTPAPTICGIK